MNPALFVGGPWDGLVFEMPDSGPDETDGPNGTTYRRTHMEWYGSRTTVYLETDTIFDAVGGTIGRMLKQLAEPHPRDRVSIEHGAVVLELRMRVGRGIPWPDSHRKYIHREAISAGTWEAARHSALSHVTAEMADRLVREVTQAGPA